MAYTVILQVSTTTGWDLRLNLDHAYDLLTMMVGHLEQFQLCLWGLHWKSPLGVMPTIFPRQSPHLIAVQVLSLHLTYF